MWFTEEDRDNLKLTSQNQGCNIFGKLLVSKGYNPGLLRFRPYVSS